MNGRQRPSSTWALVAVGMWALIATGLIIQVAVVAR